MWTDESKEAYLVEEVVTNAFAKSLLFQARVNVELFKHSCMQLHEALEKLNHHNFSAAFGGCHMNEGAFGTDIHLSNKITYTQRVLAFLLSAVTSGHRLIKCLRGAKNLDRGSDWKSVGKEISLFENEFRRVRNALEHFPDAVMKGEYSSNAEIGFTPEAIFNAKDKNGEFTFDFSKDELNRIVSLYDQVFTILLNRKENA
ncbi:MAG: hypothetical protein JMN24_18990 [gamma proteobacterium endosymbiont of Lamellibrachia anaximandri]|nr:hypothetical protein [gamma proteobacterium endosymbiont of Lamellibrachia anaximandri]MBL3619738.1 hypothetical protein [gamma proteobacterium endosymbiont of Lamellibrachia anaximandri]